MGKTAFNIFHLIDRLWVQIPQKRKKRFYFLIAFSVLAAIFEVVSIGSALPFLAALAEPDKLLKIPFVRAIAAEIGLVRGTDLVLPLTVLFCIVGFLAGFVRVALLRFSLKLAFAVGADITELAYNRTLHQSYETHISRNSSEIVSGITTKIAEVIYYVMMPGLSLISSLIISLAIVGLLVAFIPASAFLGFLAFGILYLILIRVLRSKLAANSGVIGRESTAVIKHIQEGLGGIRDIAMHGKHEYFIDKYKTSDNRLRMAQGSNQFIAQSPRFVMESGGMILIAGIAYFSFVKGGGSAGVIPMLAGMALGLQRLLPALQQSYQSWSSINGSEDSLRQTVLLLEQKIQKEKPQDRALSWNKLSLRDISFKYSSSDRFIFKNLNLTIKRGERVGIVGATGTGKSTLVDILMGLLAPTTGSVFADDLKIDENNVGSWRRLVSYVPQTIYLSDDSIAANIAFGVPSSEVDFDAVRAAAGRAQIADAIESLPGKYLTNVGERGVQLSGGQRQRLGIARAFYAQSELIFLDEATSALDSETENMVMNAVDSLDSSVTVVIIAHRIGTLKSCGRVIKLQKSDDGRVFLTEEDNSKKAAGGH